jgi:predicted Zn-dependent peptidase
LVAGGVSEATVLDPRTVSSATLQNGLVVVSCTDDNATVVSAEVIVRVGSAGEPAEMAGIAHLLEHLCWVGSPGDDPRRAVEEAGGATNAGTLRDFTRFYASFPAIGGSVQAEQSLKLALAALSRMVLRDEFDEGILERESQVIVEEVKGRQDEPRLVLNDLAFEAVFGQGHPYGRRIEGEESSLFGLSPAQLRSFHQARYVPNNMAVVVCGPVAFRSVLAAAESVFGQSAPQALAPRAANPALRPGIGGERVVRTSARDAYVMAAFVGPAASERWEVCASDVLATLLGNPLVSRLHSHLVEGSRPAAASPPQPPELAGGGRAEARPLAKAVGVDFLTQRDRALFGVWAVCEPANVPAAKDAIRQELARLAEEGIAADDLRAAKRLVYADYAFANETPADRCAALGFYEAIDSYRAATQYLGRISAVTAEDVKSVAAWYAGEPVWVVLTPEAEGP